MSTATVPKTQPRRPRIALIRDLTEENWPSMDLVADMLFERLNQEHAATLEVTGICPPLQRRFSRLPLAGPTAIFQNADRLINRFLDYPRALKSRIEEFDLFHLIDHSYSQLIHHLPPGKTVVTCHDLDTFRCVLEPEREPRPGWFRAMTDRILAGFRKATYVIADSAFTRDEILRFGLHPPERITVISNGVHPACSPDPDPVADAQLSRLLSNNYRGDSPETIWLLSVGSSIPRKRLDVLLRVFAEVRRELGNVRLLRIGEALTSEQRGLARQLGVDSAVVELGFVSREILSAAFRRARLLLQTSDAEGFGLPPVEAMACGCQVISSDLPVLREVGGTAATYCAVGDIQGWRNAVVGAIHNRNFDRARGFSNAARFSWSENAARTARVYTQVLQGTGTQSAAK